MNLSETKLLYEINTLKITQQIYIIYERYKKVWKNIQFICNVCVHNMFCTISSVSVQFVIVNCLLRPFVHLYRINIIIVKISLNKNLIFYNIRD